MLVMKYSGLPRRLSGSCLTAYIGQGPFFHVKVKVKFYLRGEIVYCHKLSKKYQWVEITCVDLMWVRAESIHPIDPHYVLKLYYFNI